MKISWMKGVYADNLQNFLMQKIAAHGHVMYKELKVILKFLTYQLKNDTC